MRTWVATVSAVVALAAPVAVTVAAQQSGASGADVITAGAERAGPADQAAADRGGPPPWAASAAQGKRAKGGLEVWKSLTPAQREATMTRLAREHKAGMVAYRACRADGRSGCVKPLPPGLAKRQ